MRIFVALAALLGAAAAIGANAPPAEACGGVFPTVVSQELGVDAQRALMVVHRLEMDVHVQLAATHGGEDFAWVIPVPDVPTLSIGDDAIFDALEAETRPSVTLARGDSGGGSLCGDAAGVDAGSNGISGVTRFSGGTVGDYTYDVIGGDSANAILKWLDDNGYVVPDDAEPILQGYADLHMRFVAVRLTAAGDRADDLAPLVMRLPTPGGRRFRYPLDILSIGAAARNPVVVWVLADKRYRVSNYGSIDVDTVATELRARDDAGEEPDYGAAIDDLTDAGGGRLFVTEYAAPLDATQLPPALAALVDDEAFYLTRLHARIPRAALGDAIVTFANDAPDVSPDVVAEAHPPVGTLLATGWPLALLLLGAARRHIRRRRSSQNATISAV